MLFDNVKPATNLSDEMPEKEEKKTPPASQAKEKTKPETGSEAAKTPEKTGEEKGKAKDGEKKDDSKKDDSEDTRFDKHSRFKEVIEERNEARKERDEFKKSVEEIRAEIANLKGVKKGDIPTFETTEDLQKYLAELPKRMKEEVLNELKSAEAEKVKGTSAADKLVAEQLEAIKDTLEDGEEFNEKALLEHALKYGITDLAKAHENLKEMNTEKSEKDKEDKDKEIEKRKKDSTIHSKTGTEKKTELAYKRGQSLDDIIENAKANIPK